MSWQIRYTRTFFKELSKIPQKTRIKIEAVVFGEEIKEDPFLEGRVQKLTGYQEYYKIRFGNYRVGLRLDTNHNVVEFQRVLHRREIYRKFP